MKNFKFDTNIDTKKSLQLRLSGPVHDDVRIIADEEHTSIHGVLVSFIEASVLEWKQQKAAKGMAVDKEYADDGAEIITIPFKADGGKVTAGPSPFKHGFKVVNNGPDTEKIRGLGTKKVPRTDVEITAGAMKTPKYVQLPKVFEACPHGYAKGMCKFMNCNLRYSK